MYRERCGIEVKESALSVCRALEENNWEGKPWGGRPDHFRHLARHIDGKVVLLRTNTPKIMDSRFGPDNAVTSAAVWSPGMREAKVYHTIQEMEEACEQACVIVVGEAERDGHRPGGHCRGASYDRSLQVAPLCVLHGIMGTLLYTRETLGQFSLRRLRLGVGGSKGHTAKGDCRRSRLVQGTQEHGPLVMMVNRIAGSWCQSGSHGLQYSCRPMRRQLPINIVLIVPHGQQCSPRGGTWVVRSGWREALAVVRMADQGEGSAQTALAVRGIGTVSIGNL